ncbi:MAG: hypothetical protein ACI4SG_09100 [Oligosphaeraceae bacterium]
MMKRYLVRVYKFDPGSYATIHYNVRDRLTGKSYSGLDTIEAFKDYKGTIQELANDMDIEDEYPILGVYGDRYIVSNKSWTGFPFLYLELNEKGKRERHWAMFHKHLWKPWNVSIVPYHK